MISDKLVELGISLPPFNQPQANYAPALVFERQLYISGQTPKRGGVYTVIGRVGAEVSAKEAYEAARGCTLNALAIAEATVGLDSIAQFLKVQCFIRTAAGFTALPSVADGCTDLLVEIFGEAGKPTRTATGAAELPGGVPVEIDFVIGLK